MTLDSPDTQTPDTQSPDARSPDTQRRGTSQAGRSVMVGVMGGGQAGKKIAVIGSGISGLSAAWALSHCHHVTLFEKDARLGGHANTVTIKVNGQPVAVDTGFIVYNDANYPNMVALFEHLGVETSESDMSFAASMRGGQCEYSGQSLRSVFATPSNLVSPRFLRMLVDITRFHRLSHKALKAGVPDGLTLRAFIEKHGLSAGFTQDFIMPMAGAIWSTPSDKILDYPARSFLQFYANHGLLQVLNMPAWRTIPGGSINYVTRLLSAFKANGGVYELSAPICEVTNNDQGTVDVTISAIRQERFERQERFDHVVLATHADQAMALCPTLPAAHKTLLSAFRYQPNRAVLHGDARAMPRKTPAWSAWNVLERDGQMALTYWMNRLQPLNIADDLFVTLNPLDEPTDIYGEYHYDHPLYDLATYKAQRDIWSIQGADNIWFAGAWMGAGFHEDGLQAGLAVAERIGGFTRPWSVENPDGRLALEDARMSLPANE